MKTAYCLLASGLMLGASIGRAQGDAAGCKDSPLVSPFPGSVITQCKDQADDLVTFGNIGQKKESKRIEGELHYAQYNWPRGSANKAQVLLKADTRKERLRKHLRGFVVKDQRNRRLVFRYYDQRVLKVYLPTCTGDELETVFGPIERFWTENAAGDGWHEFRIEGRSLLSETRSFGASRKA